jgi:hypothetical protein
MRIGQDENDHPLLSGFADTAILPGGSYLSRVEGLPGTRTLTTLIPTYPTAPPEKVYMDPDTTDIATIFLREAGGRVVYFAMDLDAAYWRSRFPDHRQLLATAVRWAAGDDEPVAAVEGRGLLDVGVWRQENSIAVHLVNLNTPNLYGGTVTELIPVPGQTLRLRLPQGRRAAAVRLLRAGRAPGWSQSDEGRLEIHVARVLDHEIVAVDLA